MRWSVRVARVAGIGIYVHLTFLLLPLWIGVTEWLETQSWTEASAGVAFLLVLFAIVVLHELAHALTARRFGIRTREITLLPIGGVARLERMPEAPRQELLVALAGPAVNVCLAAFCFALLGAAHELRAFTHWRPLGGDFVPTLMWANILIAVFNLLPAFPMDGGRVLRALLAMRWSYVRATNVAANVGQAMALVFAFAGLASIFLGRLSPVSHPFLILIGLFVWVGAAQESGMVRMKSNLGGVTVSGLLITDFRSLSPAEPLSLAVQYLRSGWQQDFPVIAEGRLLGLLTRSRLAHALAEHGPNALAGDVMLNQVPTIDAGEPAEAALLRLRAGDCPALIALAGNQVCGMLTREKVADYLLIQSALERGAAKDPCGPLKIVGHEQA